MEAGGHITQGQYYGQKKMSICRDQRLVLRLINENLFETRQERNCCSQWMKVHPNVFLSVADWMHVVCSDKSRFCLFLNDIRRRVHLQPNETFNPLRVKDML